MAIEPLTPERRRQQTRDHLLAAAAQVFAERGFHGASLDEVATVAGFTKGAVYSNFKNKEDLFLALFRARYEQETAALRATLDASDVPSEARLSDFVALFQDQTHLARSNFGLLYQEFWLYAARNPEVRSQFAQIDDEAVESLAELIAAEREGLGLDPLDNAVQTARIIEVLFRGIGLLRILQPDVADESLIEAAIVFVSRGLGATRQ
jgi:AcrR family transcriptional regulator